MHVILSIVTKRTFFFLHLLPSRQRVGNLCCLHLNPFGSQFGSSHLSSFHILHVCFCFSDFRNFRVFSAFFSFSTYTFRCHIWNFRSCFFGLFHVNICIPPSINTSEGKLGIETILSNSNKVKGIINMSVFSKTTWLPSSELSLWVLSSVAGMRSFIFVFQWDQAWLEFPKLRTKVEIPGLCKWGTFWFSLKAWKFLTFDTCCFPQSCATLLLE